MTIDDRFMRQALGLSQRALGQTWPNPSVGCVIADSDGAVAGLGWTQPGGRPHAEAHALAQAGARARGGTAYVTLEPCAHVGATGPCADALTAAGVSRVVAAIEDPDPRVSGQGFAKLRAAGVAVTTGVLAEDARQVNAGFLKRITTGRPFVTVKAATSLDGKMALSNGRSQWITGQQARAAGHMLRATHDAILTGIGTVLVDDPELTCRLPGLEHRSPWRMVLDSAARTPATSRLAKRNADRATVVLCAPNAVRTSGDLEYWPIGAGAHAGLSLDDMLDALGRKGVTRLLVEGGPRLTSAVLSAGIADQLVWFRGPLVMGGDAAAAVAALNLTDLVQAPRFDRVAVSQLGPDLMEVYAARP